MPSGTQQTINSGIGIGVGLAGAASVHGWAVALAAAGGPVGLAIAGLAAVAPLIIQLAQGCGQTCVKSSQIADRVQIFLDENKRQYFAIPAAQRTLDMKELALHNVQVGIDVINNACGDPALGAAGQRCIAERTIRGGTAPWCPSPNHTGCDIWAVYYDPILNDPISDENLFMHTDLSDPPTTTTTPNLIPGTVTPGAAGTVKPVVTAGVSSGSSLVFAVIGLLVLGAVIKHKGGL